MTAELQAYGLKFHHFGLAVKDPAPALKFLGALGYRSGEVVEDSLQNVKLIMCEHDTMPDVEIIYPAAGAGPVDKLVQRHKSGIVYHLCYHTDDLAGALAKIEADDEFRLTCVSPPKPAILFGGKPVSFYFVNGVGLIEIIDNNG